VIWGKLCQWWRRRALWKDKQQALLDAASISVTEMRSVCLLLGPYRNLTTLTASLLFLHPRVQVFNHAAPRILNDPQLDFLRFEDADVMERFQRFAIHASQGGARGSHGGSITLSHAFVDHPEIANTYRARFGAALVKPEIQSVVWKESLTTANHLRSHRVDIDALLRRLPQLRFLLPVRHPLDCAVSNQKTGLACDLPGISPAATLEQITEAILLEFAWVAALAERHPDRFFVFYEHTLTEDILRELAYFLQIEAPMTWLSDCRIALQLKPGYAHSAALTSYYRSRVEAHFPEPSPLRQSLLAFTPADH
jgi:hypothetical protein